MSRIGKAYKSDRGLVGKKRSQIQMRPCTFDSTPQATGSNPLHLVIRTSRSPEGTALGLPTPDASPVDGSRTQNHSISGNSPASKLNSERVEAQNAPTLFPGDSICSAEPRLPPSPVSPVRPSLRITIPKTHITAADQPKAPVIPSGSGDALWDGRSSGSSTC
ncbi:hypothetical protein CPB83DRAFT_106319 [Crepidotus variabilis]|uniref:Uncharacterized protein n=1 Tax=Crepidotus variabilis TaxID=179855 RepID=A0A9P6ELS7_9AGAR|nr:hypothetical protein CPB83DRAFT_106319 [Crepidotus variabilis]